jgi:hypothetical protein
MLALRNRLSRHRETKTEAETIRDQAGNASPILRRASVFGQSAIESIGKESLETAGLELTAILVVRLGWDLSLPAVDAGQVATSFTRMRDYRRASTSRLYRMDPPGEAVELISGLTIPNAICFSPDVARFYFADSPNETRCLRDG